MVRRPGRRLHRARLAAEQRVGGQVTTLNLHLRGMSLGKRLHLCRMVIVHSRVAITNVNVR
jgi:hypothetical protein